MPTTLVWTGGAADGNWGTAGNWSPAGPPVTGDTAFVTSGSSDISAGLGQSAVTLAALNVAATFKGTIGTATTPLAISATAWNIDASGSSRVNIDFGTNAFTGAATASNNNSGADVALGLERFRLKGAHASNKLYVLGGTVGIATNAIGDTATIPEIDVQGDDTIVHCGAGCTLTLLNQQDSCDVTVNSAMPTLNQGTGGTLTTRGTGALGATSLTIGGTVNSNATGNVSNAVVLGTASLNFSQSPAARSVAGVVTIYKGGTLVADKRFITLGAGFRAAGCKLSEVKVDTGADHTFTV